MATLRILADNRSVDPALPFEHGWSVWVDLGSAGAWLWDTGQTDLFWENAAHCGLDLTRAAGVALSHGHHDHAGGLPTLVAAGYAGPVIGHPDVLSRRYSRRGGSTFRSIGMGDGRLAGGVPGFRPVTDCLELAPGLTFVTGIERRPGNFQATEHLFRDTAGLEPDTVPDDACLVIDGADGPVVLLGCCHAGLANTFSHLRRRLGLTSLPTVVGGLHLAGAPPQAFDEIERTLAAFAVQTVYTGHCTGESGENALGRRFAGRMIPTGCGLVITV
jgi:7,8-dihydropterin-6-yl-methyl-4-(beta-D-ribofuranosyl)aminobenzene 5'-phosphate synthase